MKKTILLTALLIFCGTNSYAQQEDGVAQVTSFTPTVGQTLIFEEERTDTQEKVFTHITLNKITPRIEVTFVLVDKDNNVLTTTERIWVPAAKQVFDQVLQMPGAKRKSIVVDNLRFGCVEVVLEGKLYVFATDGDIPLFPGVLLVGEPQADGSVKPLSRLVKVLSPSPATRKVY